MERAAAGRIVIIRAHASARQTDLAQHTYQSKGHPMRLLAVLNSLNAPAHHDHGAVVGQLMRQGTNFVRRDSGNVRGPFRCFRSSVRLPEKVVSEDLETGLYMFLRKFLSVCQNFRVHTSCLTLRRSLFRA